MVWLLFGTALHNVLEHHQESESELKEERLHIPVNGYILSGKPDLYDYATCKITDYKTASVWKIIYESFDDWRKQTLIYSYMMRQYGFPVHQAEIVAFLKDHRKAEAKRKADYPKLPVHPVKFRFDESDFADIEGWLHERMGLVKQLELLPDDELPICTQEERFNDGDKFAVMAKGRKTALRVLDSESEAQAWMAANKKGDSIERRKGEDKKCADYCFCNQFCNYYLDNVGVQNERQLESLQCC
jgi:hypothetical protein